MAPQKKSLSTKKNSSAAPSSKSMKATRGVNSSSRASANLNKSIRTTSRAKSSSIAAGFKASSPNSSRVSASSGKSIKATRGGKSSSMASANLNKAMKTASRAKSSPLTAGSKASSSNASRASVSSGKSIKATRGVKSSSMHSAKLNKALKTVSRAKPSSLTAGSKASSSNASRASVSSGKSIKATRGVKSSSMPSAKLNKALKTASRAKPSSLTAGSKASASRASISSASKFDLNNFISEKFQNIDDTSLNQAIAGTKKSSLGDLIAFNTALAHSYYKISDQDSLEAVTYALQSEGTIKDQVMSPSVAEAYTQLTHFHDLLLLDDLPSVTQNMKPHSMIQAAHTLSSPAQVALMTSFLGLAMKLTGSGLSRLQISLPGGKIRGKDRSEVMAYLSLMRNVADTVAESNMANPSGQSQAIQKMHADLVKIINNY